MKRLTALLALLAAILPAATLRIGATNYRIDDKNGRLAAVTEGGKTILAGAENRYLLMTK